MTTVYRLPTFNLTCNIWHTDWYPATAEGPPDLVVVCQLRINRGTFGIPIAPFGANNYGVEMWLNMPKGTDIRGRYGLGLNNADTAEVPAGSGRWYTVLAVDDVAKGFDNEYRVACLAGYFSPVPIP